MPAYRKPLQRHRTIGDQAHAYRREMEAVLIRTLAVVALAIVPLVAHVLYKCTDPKTGKVSYSDAACPLTQADTKMEWTPRAATNSVDSGRRRGPNPNLSGPSEAASLLELYRRWVDAEVLAASTSRIALSGPVAALQDLKRQAGALGVVPCLAEVKTKLTQLVARSADAYLSFMRDEGIGSMVYQIVDREKGIAAFEDSIANARCGR